LADKNVQIPVYLFTGFLEAGKTKFIQETLEDKRFNGGEKTLLIVCEEGIVDYAPDAFFFNNVYLQTVTDESAFSSENLISWLKQSKAERVLIEYNGMWMLDTLYNVMPENWAIAQEFMFADAATFLTYNANMRQLCFDKLKSCELVVFNRFDPSMDKMAFHKIVRGASRRADIAFEYKNGKVEFDDIQDPLPFDLNAPIIEIDDRDYALWYRDMSEEPKKYAGKTVRFLGRAAKNKKVPAGCFIVGRHVMTCCVQDMQFAGLICEYPEVASISNGGWVRATAKIDFKMHRSYGRRGPVLTAISIAPAEAPEEPVATFY
jgi:hypothetical protein